MSDQSHGPLDERPIQPPVPGPYDAVADSVTEPVTVPSAELETEPLAASPPTNPAASDVPPPPGPIAASPTPQPPISWSGSEQAATPVVTRVQAVSVRRGRRSGLRWGIALLVVALVAGTASAAFYLMSGSALASPLRAYAPSGSLAYVELRADLPGNQRAQLGTFLSHFPGFADQANLDAKLAEALDRIIKGATNDAHDYSSEIKPWFGGQISIVVPKLPSMTAFARPGGAAYVTVTDATKAKAYLDQFMKNNPPSAEMYQGVTLYIVGAGAYALDGSVLILGDTETVRGSIDAARHTGGKASIADDAGFKSAIASVSGDWLVFMYANLGAIAAASNGAMPSLPPGMPNFQACSGQQGAAALAAITWEAVALRAEGSLLRVEVALPSGGMIPTRAKTASRLATRLPATTIVQYDIRDLGKTLLTVLNNCRTDPVIANALKQADQAVAALGGWDAMLGWIGDADLVATRDGGSVAGGVVVQATTPEGASRIVTQVRNLIALAGSSTGVKTTEEEYAGTTITLVRQSDSSATPGFPGIAFAVRDDLVVVGWGDAFVKAVLDAKAGSSLADQERYKQAMGLVGAENSGQAYVDIAAVREAIEAIVPDGPGKDRYLKEYEPYLAPFDVTAASGTIDGQVMKGQFVLTVK
jgi:uncharacterized protein DUF3352